jgi:preprotein translocase subunit YajC
MKKPYSMAIVFLILAAALAAHGTYTHVMGTVTKIADDAVTVETTDKQTTVVKIAANTSFIKNGEAATLKDLKVGDRVVIHAKPIGADLVAHEVRFGKAPATAGAAH